MGGHMTPDPYIDTHTHTHTHTHILTTAAAWRTATSPRAYVLPVPTSSRPHLDPEHLEVVLVAPGELLVAEVGVADEARGLRQVHRRLLVLLQLYRHTGPGQGRGAVKTRAGWGQTALRADLHRGGECMHSSPASVCLSFCLCLSVCVCLSVYACVYMSGSECIWGRI